MLIYLLHPAHRHHLDIELRRTYPLLIVFGNKDPLKPQLLGLGYPLFDPVHRPDLTTQPYLPRKTDPRGQRYILVGTEQGAKNGKIDGGVLHLQTTRNIEKDILYPKMKTTPLLQHRQQQLQPAQVEPAHRPLRRAIYRLGHQRLHLDQQRPQPFDRRGNGNTTQLLLPLRDQQLTRIADTPHAALGHFIDPQLSRTAKTILQRPEDAIGIMTVTLELQNSIDHMLEYFRTRNASILGNMTDQKHRRIGLLCKTLEFGRAFPDLADTARGGFDVGRLQGLDGIHDHQLRTKFPYLLEDHLCRSLRYKIKIIVADIQP